MTKGSPPSPQVKNKLTVLKVDAGKRRVKELVGVQSPKSGFYDTELELTTDPVQENISDDFIEVDSLHAKRPCDTSGESSEELHASKKKRADSLRVKRPRDTLGESSEELHASKKKRV